MMQYSEENMLQGTQVQNSKDLCLTMMSCHIDFPVVMGKSSQLKKSVIDPLKFISC